jgi:DsbC/DsbD-like thiol-disulfide interchange protein
MLPDGVHLGKIGLGDAPRGLAMRRSIRYRLLLIWMATAPALACYKAPPSAARANKSDSSVEKPNKAVLMEEPTAEKPVVATALLRPAKGSTGDTLDLVVEIRIAAGWHIYAGGALAGTAIPTSLTEKLPEGTEAAGAWQYPRATSTPDAPGEIYEGRLTFRRPLRITERARAGRIDVTCELTYQACDPFHCLPPQTLSLSARGEVESAH